jgi:hypothetical protein
VGLIGWEGIERRPGRRTAEQLGKMGTSVGEVDLGGLEVTVEAQDTLWPAVEKGANVDHHHYSPLSCFWLFDAETFEKTCQVREKPSSLTFVKRCREEKRKVRACVRRPGPADAGGIGTVQYRNDDGRSNVQTPLPNTKVFLHSHPERYPLRYEDDQISSQGMARASDYLRDAHV